MSFHLQKVLSWAVNAHSTQFRYKGNEPSDILLPYSVHSVEVFKLLYKWGVRDEETLSASLLHDVVEDTNFTVKDIESIFGPATAKLVEELTHDPKIDKLEYKSSFDKKSIKSLVIKVGDQICNLSDYCVFDVDAAAHYYKGARKVFNTISARSEEIKRVFGNRTYLKLCVDVKFCSDSVIVAAINQIKLKNGE